MRGVRYQVLDHSGAQYSCHGFNCFIYTPIFIHTEHESEHINITRCLVDDLCDFPVFEGIFHLQLLVKYKMGVLGRKRLSDFNQILCTS